MAEPLEHALEQVLKRDPRYPIQAYEFVSLALSYAHEIMGLGKSAESREAKDEPERHLTGQELCEAGRRLALEQYGLMAKTVLNSWGLQSTSDIGEIVYNMIDVDLMRRSDSDRREDFDDVFDFQRAFRDDFDFAESLKPRRSQEE